MTMDPNPDSTSAIKTGTKRYSIFKDRPSVIHRQELSDKEFTSSSPGKLLCIILLLIIILQLPILAYLSSMITIGDTRIIYDDIYYTITGQDEDTGKHDVLVTVYLTNIALKDSGSLKLEMWAINTTLKDRNIVDDNEIQDGIRCPKMQTISQEFHLELYRGTYRLNINMYQDDENLENDKTIEIIVL